LICRSLDWIAAATQMACAQEVLAVSSRPAFALHWLIPNIVAFQLSQIGHHQRQIRGHKMPGPATAHNLQESRPFGLAEAMGRR
jgi:hypothetical protein